MSKKQGGEEHIMLGGGTLPAEGTARAKGLCGMGLATSERARRLVWLEQGTGRVLSRSWCERSRGSDHTRLTGHFKNTGFSLKNTRSHWKALS